MAKERLAEEGSIADFEVRYLEVERMDGPHFYAAASPISDEWCYLAHTADLEELRQAAEILLGEQNTRAVVERCSALMGVPWQEGAMVPLLVRQEREGRRLMVRAPSTMDADPSELRKMREQAAEDVARESS